MSEAARATTLTVEEWIAERLANCERIAAAQRPDRDGWLEDAAYFRQIAARLEQTAGLRTALYSLSAELTDCLSFDETYVRMHIRGMIERIADALLADSGQALSDRRMANRLAEMIEAHAATLPEGEREAHIERIIAGLRADHDAGPR